MRVGERFGSRDGHRRSARRRAVSDSFAEPDVDRNSDSDRDADTDRNSKCDADRDADGNTDSDCNADADADADGDFASRQTGQFEELDGPGLCSLGDNRRRCPRVLHQPIPTDVVIGE